MTKLRRITALSVLVIICVSAAGQKRRSSRSKNPTNNNPIRQVDFRNFTYPLDQMYADLYQRKTARLKNGKLVISRDAEGTEGVAIRKIIYGDLTGDSAEEAIVILMLGSIDGAESSQQAPGTYAYIYTMVNGNPSLLTIFDAEPEESDAQKYYRDHYGDNTMLFYPGITKVVDGLLVLESLAGRGRGSPGYQVTMMFRWDGQRFVLEGKPQRRRIT